MKVIISGITIEDVSIDDLGLLIEKYGRDIAPQSNPESKPPATGAATSNGVTNQNRATSDSVLLRKFIDASPSGIKTADVGSMLGKGGKAIRPAAKEWAYRVGLTADVATDPFVDCRVGVHRGVRLNGPLLEVAKELAKK